MHDQRYDGDHKKDMNEAACNMERQPRHDPNNKQEYCQNQEDEISHALFTLNRWSQNLEKTYRDNLVGCGDAMWPANRARFLGILFGSSGRIRTYNPSVNSRMLCR